MSRTKETAEGLVRNSSRSGMAAAALFTAARLSGQPAGYFFCLRAEDHGLCPISHGCFPVILALLAGSRHGIYRHKWTIGYYLAGLSSWLLLSSSMKRVRGCMLQSTATYILLPWPHKRIKYELHRYLLRTALDEVWLVPIEAAVSSLSTVLPLIMGSALYSTLAY